MLRANRLRYLLASITDLSKTSIFIICVLTVLDISIIPVFWRGLNPDLNDVIPWYQFLLEHGRFSALGREFSIYTPPYLYLLSIGTFAHNVLDPAIVIRAIAVSFNAIALVLVYLFAVARGWPRSRAIQIALLFFLLPEMVVNSLVWGQSDIIYTLFLMAFIYFLLKERDWLATMMLGISFAFKLQTVFIGPFVLYLLLVRLLLWRHLVMVPLMYLIFMVPSAIAGRSWGELLTIYVGQLNLNRYLSMGAPNLYLAFQKIFPSAYELGLYMGLMLAVTVSVALVAVFIRRRRGRLPDSLLLMATVTLTIMPYVLPKMHERYFFPASAMAFLLAVMRPSSWPILALIQTANLCSYAPFLLSYSRVWIYVGAIPMTCALGSLIWLLLLEPKLPAQLGGTPVKRAIDQTLRSRDQPYKNIGTICKGKGRYGWPPAWRQLTQGSGVDEIC